MREAGSVPLRAVRVIGLAEGHLPPVPWEDPVILDAARARLLAAGAGGAAIGPANASDRTIEALQAFDGVIRNAGARVTLSFSRLDADRSMREPASVILAAAALGRPHAVTREPGPVIPDGAALVRDAFRSSPAVRSRVRAATAPDVCFRPSCRPADLDLWPAPAGTSRLTADSTVLYQAEGRSKGEPGVAARVSENGLYVVYDVSARMRLARSAIERKHGSSLVITALLV